MRMFEDHGVLGFAAAIVLLNFSVLCRYILYMPEIHVLMIHWEILRSVCSDFYIVRRDERFL